MRWTRDLLGCSPSFQGCSVSRAVSVWSAHLWHPGDCACSYSPCPHIFPQGWRAWKNRKSPGSTRMRDKETRMKKTGTYSHFQSRCPLSSSPSSPAVSSHWQWVAFSHGTAWWPREILLLKEDFKFWNVLHPHWTKCFVPSKEIWWQVNDSPYVTADIYNPVVELLWTYPMPFKIL